MSYIGDAVINGQVPGRSLKFPLPSILEKFFFLYQQVQASRGQCDRLGTTRFAKNYFYRRQGDSKTLFEYKMQVMVICLVKNMHCSLIFLENICTVGCLGAREPPVSG